MSSKKIPVLKPQPARGSGGVWVVACPVCGAEVPISGIGGRKRLNISVVLVCDALKRTHSVEGAAQELKCSRGYIYKVLKAERLTPEEVIGGGKTS